MQSVSTFFWEENDFLYKRGYLAGLKKTENRFEQTVVKMLKLILLMN